MDFVVERGGTGTTSRAAARLASRALLALGTWSIAACESSMGPSGSSCAAAGGRGDAGISLSLAPGEICTLVASDAEAVEIQASSDAAEYLVVVQSGDRVPGSRASLRLETRSGIASASRAATLVAAPPLAGAHASAQAEASLAELRFRASARAAIRNAVPHRTAQAARPLSEARASTVGRRRAAVGDTIIFHNSVDTDLAVDCDGIHDVTTVVRAMGQSFGIVEDVEAAGPVTVGEYTQVLTTLDASVFPVTSTYFGDPGDLDGNGVIWMMFTPVVNRTTPRGSSTRISGFFNPSDLSTAASCPASNEAEILYVLAADPTGRFSNPVPASFATSRAIGVAAHELEHLISAERRVILGGGSFADLEDAWLGEGLAHSAETFVGMAEAGQQPGQNYSFAELTAARSTFDTFHFPNLRRAGYYLADSNGTLALGDDEGSDPGGVSSLEMRGFGWMVLRWLADQYARPGSGFLGGAVEEAIFRELASGGAARTRGIANIERVAGIVGAPADWESLVSVYALAPLADDAAGAATASTQVTSFHLRDTYAALNQELQGEEPFETPYPLRRTTIRLDGTTATGINFDLAASTGRYFVLESPGAHPDIAVSLTTPSGAIVPASARAKLIVLRTR